MLNNFLNFRFGYSILYFLEKYVFILETVAMDGWTFIIGGYYSVGAISTLLVLRLVYLAFCHSLVSKTPFHSFINLAIIILWVLLIVETTPLSNPVSDYGAPIGFALTLVVVPVCYIISWVLRRGESIPVKSYVILSRVLWGVQIIPGVLMVFFMYAWASGR